MNELQQKMFFRTMMTGLFVGIVDTVICLAYNIFYRDATGFIPSTFINVSSIIFAVCLLLTVIGMVYYAFLRAFRKGDIVFAVVFLAATIFLAVKAEAINRFSNYALDHGFRGLLTGIILIVGLSSASLPLWYHSKKFEEFIV